MNDERRLAANSKIIPKSSWRSVTWYREPPDELTSTVVLRHTQSEMFRARILIVMTCAAVPIGSVLVISDGCDARQREAPPPRADSGQRQSPTRYEGRTVEQWQAVIQTIDFSSSEAKDAVPGLIAVCRDPKVAAEVRAQSAYTLARIGEPAQAAVPVLEQLLPADSETQQDSTAQWAAKALAGFGPLAAPATPTLVELADDPKRGLLERQAAMEALGRIGGAHADAIPVLIKLSTADGSGESSELVAREIQTTAIDSLMFAGPAASAAVPGLIQLTRSPSSDLRRAAAATLGAVGPAAGIASSALVDLVLFDELPVVRDTATASLARLGEPGETSLSHLLRDEDVFVRKLAAAALGGIERPADATRQALVEALGDAEADVRLTAAESLVKLNHDAVMLIPMLLDSLTDENRQPRIRAYRLLIEMRDAAEVLLPRLERLADDPRPYVRQVARKAFAQLAHSESVE